MLGLAAHHIFKEMEQVARGRSSTAAKPVEETVESTEFEVEAPRELKPADLKDFKGTLYARNNTVAQIIHSVPDETPFKIGSVLSGDNVAVLPLNVAQHPSFQKLWRRGDVTITTDPEMENVLALAATKQELMEAARTESIMKLMEADPSRRDMVQIVKADGTSVFMSVEQLETPLTPEEAEKDPRFNNPNYIQEIFFDRDSEENRVKFARVSLSETLRGAK